MGTAVISDCGTYRYRLDREWEGGGGLCVFMMLNPSTADAEQDDPTIRRCIGFAKDWGYASLSVVNLYGFRATKPADLWKANDPIGPDNHKWAELTLVRASRVVLAWGAGGGRNDRGQKMEEILRMRFGIWVVTLGRTKGGEPRHPLYIRKDFVPDTGGRGA